MIDAPADDDAFVSRLRYGDATAARDLYERHGAALLRFGLAMTACRHTAEDMVHDTFVEVLQDPQRIDPARGSVASYLYGVARHRLSRLMRSTLYRVDDTSREAVVADDIFEATLPQDTGSPHAAPTAEEELDRTRLIERVRQAVLDLPFTQREVVALCDLEELPYATVASILGCPIGTVRSRLHRARGLLATRLASLGVRQDAHAHSPNPGVQREDKGAAGARLTLELPCKGTAT